MLEHPAISAQHIAFCYDGDLWVAGRGGESPRRLTSHPGTEVAPRFSPDGQSLAFTGEYDGNLDVYVVPVSGGSPRRLTWHPEPDFVEDFSPDGASILFSSGRNSFTTRYRQLYTVPVAGGFPTRLPIPNGLRASYSADGTKIAYIPIGERFQQWKNYRGGTCSRIWIYNVADHSVEIIPQPEGRCNDTHPVFVGNQLYFRSDRDGEFNLFTWNREKNEVVALTRFGDFPVNNLSACEDMILLEQAGYLHQFSPATGQTERMKIGLTTDAIETRARFAEGAQWIRNAAISPKGNRAVFEFRGEIVTVPADKGDPRNLTGTPGVHERSPAWSPDGRTIAWFSDAGGEYHLELAPQDGKGEVRRIPLPGNGFYEEPRWSPDGTRISFRDNSWSLYVHEIASGRTEKICSEPKYGPPDVRGLHHAWSPDSRWLAYTVNTDALIQQAFVHEIATNRSTPVSDGMSEVSEPCFDSSGKYLYFLASTDAGPVKHWFAMSNNDMRLTNRIYVAVLDSKTPNPLARESDEEVPAEEKAGEAKPGSDLPPSGQPEDRESPTADGDAKLAAAGTSGEKQAQEAGKPAGEEAGKAARPAVPEVRIDFEGLDQRILALPLPAELYSSLAAGPDGGLLVIQQDAAGKRSLVSFNWKDRKPNVLLESGAGGFAVSADLSKVLYASDGAWSIAPSAGRFEPGKVRLKTDAIMVRIDPRQEWNQIFEEVWRINRDYFYDPGMHGCNWVAMREKYRPLLAHCVTRDDLNRVLMWMCSELSVGHHGVGGGEDIKQAKSVPGGLLGADFAIENGRYRFTRILGGLNWNGELRAPLTEPGVQVKVGDYLLAVNGVELKSDDSVFRLLENTAGRITELRVGADPEGKDARIVRVVPVASEAALRNRDWIESNLRRVHAATGGRVGYVYVPNTTSAGHEYFKRYFFPQTDKQAMIIDERFNGGGQVADYYIDHLTRPYVSHWATRYGKDFITPTGTIFGPKVMLIDETAGSGGDLLPYMFRKLGVGTLVGRRTWGGLVGILGYPELMDGGQVTAPNVAIWTEEGFVVENEGVPPDVEVEQLPAEMLDGKDPQLEKAIAIVLEQLEKNPPREYRKPAYPVRVRR